MKNLTIAIVDTAYHTLASRAIDKAVEVTGADSVLVLSDRDFYPGSTFVKIDTITTKLEYSNLMLKELGKHATKDFMMTIQYDGIPTDPTKWQPEFLNYDYIGAPWPWFPENYRVGNGGFSLRSKRLTDNCLDDYVQFRPGAEEYQEDVHIGVLYKDWLSSKGVTYAPVSLASKFSAETPGGKFDTYGFHGTLCLPFYLDDNYLSFYISNLTEKMLTGDAHIRILYGLFRAERYEHVEHYMDHAVSINPNFKQVLLDQFPGDTIHYPGMTLEDIEQLLINY